jgi:hypothetical protein
MSCENIFRNGEPKVRFTGDELKFLKDVRSGKYDFDYLMEEADKLEKCCVELHHQSDLPEDCNINQVDKLYQQILNLRKEC